MSHLLHLPRAPAGFVAQCESWLAAVSFLFATNGKKPEAATTIEENLIRKELTPKERAAWASKKAKIMLRVQPEGNPDHPVESGAKTTKSPKTGKPAGVTNRFREWAKDAGNAKTDGRPNSTATRLWMAYLTETGKKHVSPAKGRADKALWAGWLAWNVTL